MKYIQGSEKKPGAGKDELATLLSECGDPSRL